jgi:hypothetical protein
MKIFIRAIALLSLFACTPIVPTATEQSQLSPASELVKNHPQDGTLTSEYVPGSSPSASFEAFVSARELSGNGVNFTPVHLSQLSFLSGPFAYISRKYDDGTTIYTMDVFTNYHVAEYEATRSEALNLFLIQGEKSQAKKNMALWCEAQGPQTEEEARAGMNRVICFGFLDVE